MPRLSLVRAVVASSLAFGALAAPAGAAPKPNILFVLVDDLDARTAGFMPRVQQRLAGEGATLERAYTQYALCSPSRATILTGRYAQNNGVRRNLPEAGGFEAFVGNGNHLRSVNVWLRAAGYRTGVIGKFMNGYPNRLGGNQVLPDWDYWAVSPYANPYNYKVNENGRWVRYGSAPQDYDTDVYRAKALAFVEDSVRRGQPFALFLSFGQLHSPVAAAPRHRGLFRGAIVPRTPAFNEADIGDKPFFLRPVLRSPEAIRSLDAMHGERLRSAQAIDEAVEALYGALSRLGQLSRTYIVFTSDNGFHLGEHRFAYTKGFAYEDSIRIPLLVRGPGIPAKRRIDRLVGNADLAPTFAAWAGVTPPVEVDGRSLAGLLTAADPAALPWRRAIPLSKLPEAPTPVSSPFKEPDLDPRVTSGYGCVRGAARKMPEMRGVRTDRYTFAHWASGDVELYDNQRDPYQVANAVCGADPALRQRLRDLAAALSTCRGALCQRLEDTAVP